MSDCGDVWSANDERIIREAKRRFKRVQELNRVTDLENEISLLNLAIVTLRVELADCRAAMHEAGLTFVDPPEKPAFPARALMQNMRQRVGPDNYWMMD